MEIQLAKARESRKSVRSNLGAPGELSDVFGDFGEMTGNASERPGDPPEHRQHKNNDEKIDADDEEYLIAMQHGINLSAMLLLARY